MKRLLNMAVVIGMVASPCGVSRAAIEDPTIPVPRAALALQPMGTPFPDPAFGTTLRRLTGTTPGGYATHTYSQLQAFSADNAFVLLIENDAYVVRRVADLALMGGFDTSEWNAPRWQPALAHTLLSYDTNGDSDVTVQYTNVDSGLTTDVYTFPSQYVRIRGNQSFDELSHDGRWMAGMLTRGDGASVIFGLDLDAGALGAILPVPALYDGPCQPDPVWGEVEPDWIGVSPLGNYLVVQWARDGTSRCSGLESFDIRTGAFMGRVYDGHQHGDLGHTADGNEFFMTIELSSPMDTNRPALSYRVLPGAPTVAEPVYLRVLDWSDGLHISCQGPPGVCLVSMGGWDGDGWTPFEMELFLQRVDGSVSRFAHHRSTQCGYWVQPRASLSRDGTLAIFASDWRDGTGTDSCGGSELGRGESYLAEIAASSCGDGTMDEGEQCDDGNTTSGDGCDADCTSTGCGDGIVSSGESCDDGNLLDGDCCSASCMSEPADSDCGDGNVCNGDEFCDGTGRCTAGIPLDCSDGDLCTQDLCDAVLGCSNLDAPAPSCVAPERSAVKIVNDESGRSRMMWRWTTAAGAGLELGDPAANTGYALCAWDNDQGVPQRSMTMTVGDNAPWQPLRDGFLYRDDGSISAGLQLLKLLADPSGRSSLTLRAKGPNLRLPSPVSGNRMFAQDPSLVVQLHNSQGSCWVADLATAVRNRPDQFMGRIP